MNVARLYRRFAIAATCLLIVGLFPARILAAGPSTYYVSPNTVMSGGSCADPDANDIQAAVALAASGDTIHICAGTYDLSSDGVEGPITISGKALSFVGDDARTTILDAHGENAIFVTDSAIGVDSLTLKNGFSGTIGGAIEEDGGASAAVTVGHSTFHNNLAGVWGGAIYAAGGLLNVNDSTFSSNSSGLGGAIYTVGPIAIANSTFSANVASVSFGGAILADGGSTGSISILNSTFADNSAATAGDSFYNSSSRYTSFYNDIFSSSGTNCAGTVSLSDSSLGTDTSCGTSGNTAGELALQSLANNGGPTDTIALGLSSVAIGGGFLPICTGSPVSGLDQRGRPRPVGAACDAGAFEAQPSVLTVSPATAGIRAGATQSYTATAVDSFGNNLGDVTADTDFSIDGTGTCIGTACGSDDFGSYTVTGTAKGGIGVTGSATLDVGASQLVISGSTTPVAGTGSDYTVTAEDVNGHTVTSYSGSTDVTVTTSDSAATLDSPINLTAGVGTSHITFETAGPQTVHATDGTFTAQAFDVTVAPGDINRFVVTVSSPQTAGTPFSVSATAVDQYGNTITDYHGTPTLSNDFSVNADHPSVPGTFPAFVNGTATSHGDTVDYTAESGRTVTVTDGPTTGTSNAFTVNAGPLDHFVVDPISNHDAGVGFSVSATAVDAYGNTVTGYTGTPTLTTTFGSNPGHSPVVGTFSAFVLGQGTATPTTDYTAETGRTVTVHGGGKTGTSNAFDIVAGSATVFVITAIPTQTVGVPFTVTAKAVDSYGNLDTSYTGTPTLTTTLSDNGSFTAVAGSFGPFIGGQGTSDGTTVGYLAQTGRTVTVTDGGVTGTSNTFTVQAGALDHFVINTVSSQAAGAAFGVTATAKDQYGNTVTSYTGTPTLTNNFSVNGAHPPVSGTFTAFVSGVGTSTGTIDYTAETSRTVTVNGGGKTGTSNTFNVGTGSGVHFVVTVGTSQVVGTPFSVTAIVKDTWGNTVTTYTGTPALTNNFSANGAHPPVAGTFPAFVSGTGTSNGNTIDYTAEANRTVTLTDGSITGTSNAFTVAPGTLDHFVLTAIPTQHAGTAFGVTARAADVYGNTVTSYTGTPTLTNNFSTNLAHPKVNGAFSAFVLGQGTSSGTIDYTAETSRTVTVTAGSVNTTSNTFDVLVGSLDHFAVTTVPAQTAGVPFTVSATAVDAYGNTVNTYTGKPTITTNLSANGLRTPVAGSMHNFVAGIGSSDGTTVGYLAQAARTVTLTDAAVTGTSNAFAVNPGPLDHFVIDVIATQTAGAAFGVTARATDVYGNTVTSYTRTPVLSNNFSSTNGTPLAGTFAAFTAGLGTSAGTVDYTAESSRTVTVTDGAIHTTSNGFAVNSGALDHFSVGAVASQTAGVAFGVSATAKDHWNNTVTGYVGTPVLTNTFSATHGAPVAGTFAAFVGGTGSASGIKDFTAETSRTVTLTDSSSHKTGTSAAFSVVPGPAAKLAISGPATAAVGVAQTYTVSATDQYGNATPAYTGTVATTSSDLAMVSSPASKALVAGVGTFAITFNSVGARTLGAHDTVATAIVAPAFAVTISSGVGSTYRTIDPVRVLDTRLAGTAGKLKANTPITFTVIGGTIPSGTSAVTGNLTVVGPTGGWAVYIGPDPIAAPKSSTINFNAGETAFNGVTVALSSTGSLSATYMGATGSTTDLIFDVTGFFVKDNLGATFHPLATPFRSLDTRTRIGGLGKFAANVPQSWKVAGVTPIPSNAIAVTGNLTVINPSSGYAIYLGPTPQTKPKTSTVNFVAKNIKGNNVTVGLSTGTSAGYLSATYMSTAGNTTDAVFDITGYYTSASVSGGAKFFPINPLRVLDTRTPSPKPIVYGTPRNFQVAGVTAPGQAPVPFGAVAVTANLTVTGETSGWAVYIGPAMDAAPTSWSINFQYPDTHSNELSVPLSADGKGTLWATYMSSSGQSTHIVFDVTGYFAQ